MSERVKFAHRLKELGEAFLKLEEDETAFKRSAASQPQEQQQQAKKPRTGEPAAQQSAPVSSYQRLRENNRSLKEVLEQLNAVNQMSNISEARRATLITAIMREGGLEGDDIPASSQPSPSAAQQQQQQQHPYAQLQQQQQQQQGAVGGQPQQQPPQPQEDYPRLVVPGDRAGRRTFLEKVLGPFGASLFANPEGGMGHQQDFKNENAALDQTLSQALAGRLEAGEEPGLLGFAAMAANQRANNTGQIGAGGLAAAQQLANETLGGANLAAN